MSSEHLRKRSVVHESGLDCPGCNAISGGDAEKLCDDCKSVASFDQPDEPPPPELNSGLKMARESLDDGFVEEPSAEEAPPDEPKPVKFREFL